MIEEFDLPSEIIDRKVTKMKMISPSNREVDVGKTLSEREYIGMCRREVFDDYLRKRAIERGATAINGLFMGLNQEGGPDGPITIKYNDYDGSKVRYPEHKVLPLWLASDHHPTCLLCDSCDVPRHPS